MQNRVFFPQVALDAWVVDGRIDMGAEEVTLLGAEGDRADAGGRRYRLEEAVRVLAEVTGATCPHGLVGKVKRRTQLLELGAELMEQSMIIGDNAYDVSPGWLGTPIGPSEESDEALLARFIARGSP